MDMSRFQNLGTNMAATFSPFAARTGQFVREQFGQAEDKVGVSLPVLPTPVSNRSSGPRLPAESESPPPHRGYSKANWDRRNSRRTTLSTRDASMRSNRCTNSCSPLRELPSILGLPLLHSPHPPTDDVRSAAPSTPMRFVCCDVPHVATGSC